MIEKISSNENEERREYITWLQDYANVIMMLGTDFTHECNSDPAVFKQRIIEHPITLPAAYILKRKSEPDENKLMEYCGDKITEINNLIERLKLEENPSNIRRVINKILSFIYRGNNSALFEDPQDDASLLDQA